MEAEKGSVNGNPDAPTPRPSRELYVAPHMRNRESQSSNVCVPPRPGPSAPVNPSSSSGWNRDVGPARPLSRTGSCAAESEVNPLANDLIADDLFDQENTGINFGACEDIPVETISGVDVPLPVNTFTEMGLGEALDLSIQSCKFAKPTPVQKYAIPILLAGRDLMACAQSGSGKTAAFCFPIIAGILRSNAPPQPQPKAFPLALILSPTKESSCQIHKEATNFARETGIKVVVAHGGESITTAQICVLNGSGVDILVATPGQLADLFEKGQVSLSKVKYLALDEADRMLDMRFEPQIRKIVEQMDMPSAGKRQTLLFSATFPKEIQKLASDFLYNYIFLAVGRVGSSTGLPVHSTLLIHSSGENMKPVNKPPGDCSKKFENYVALGFFDGAFKRQICGCGATLLLSSQCRYDSECKYDLFWNGGTGSSMKAEILALWGLLWFAKTLGLKKISICGDCQVVINHMNNKCHINKESLALWMEIINELKNHFTSISFYHVNRNENRRANLLSRKGWRFRRGKMGYRFMRADGNTRYGTVDLPEFVGYDYCCLN